MQVRIGSLIRLNYVKGSYEVLPGAAMHQCFAECATESVESRTHVPSHSPQSLEQGGSMTQLPSGASENAAESHADTHSHEWKDAHAAQLPLCRSEYVREIHQDRKPAPPQEGKFSGQPTKDARIIESICRILESQVWGPNTEPLLKPYAHDLSPYVVAGVILKQKNLSMAKCFFQWSGQGQQHNSYVYHALLIRLGEGKWFDEMWQLLDEMRAKGCSVCGTSFSILVKAYGAAGLPHQALDTLKRAHEFNVSVDTHVYTSLLGVLFKARMVAEARSIYKRMLQDKCEFDGSVWSTLIRGFSRNGLTVDAEECWKVMSDCGCEPALNHYNAFIEGLCESNNLCKALTMLSALKTSGLKSNAYTFNPLLVALCKASRFSDAFELFLEMKKDCTPNQATYNMLLEGLFLDTEVSKAIELYEWLEGGGWVDSRTYFLLAAGLRKAKQVSKLISVSENLHAKYGAVNVWLCNALLHCLCDQADISIAASYFNRMLDGLTHPDVVSFATMINGYCKLHKVDDAKMLLSVMDGEGHKPNAFCYSPLIATALKLGKVSDGLTLFKEMLSKGLEPNAVSCDFLLRKLSNASMVDESLWLLTHICSRSFHIHQSTFAALMTCLTNEGKCEKAREVSETLEERGCLVDGRPVKKALKLLNRTHSSGTT